MHVCVQAVSSCQGHSSAAPAPCPPKPRFSDRYVYPLYRKVSWSSTEILRLEHSETTLWYHQDGGSGPGALLAAWPGNRSTLLRHNLSELRSEQEQALHAAGNGEMSSLVAPSRSDGYATASPHRLSDWRLMIMPQQPDSRFASRETHGTARSKLRAGWAILERPRGFVWGADEDGVLMGKDGVCLWWLRRCWAGGEGGGIFGMAIKMPR